MFWADKLVSQLNSETPHIVNDSKTPSGRAHVGALRGVIIHDVVFRVLREHGINARYTFGVDDYDPLDELPYGRDEQFVDYLGKPLCNVPAPPESGSSDMAEYYISEFFSVFKYLGVKAETYRLRDVYNSGKFDESIDAILSHSDIVREVYLSVSGSTRPDNWHPFQVVCENCGKIGTTEATDYDGKEVTYTCHRDMVKWASGCGYKGKVSPFTGNGKLPWKLEWVAKWATMGITIEGAGKDHTTKGGSRDVAAACLQKIFGKTPPVNIPYEFFLVGGAKMSSSKGIGVSAGDMADFLPPEILRFLMLQSQPKKPINFSPDAPSITKLFNDFDRYRALADQGRNDDVAEMYRLSEVFTSESYESINFQLLQALVQLPHIDVVGDIRRRVNKPLSDTSINKIEKRIKSVKYWLENYASESEKLELKLSAPENVLLSEAQKAFLFILSKKLKNAEWTDTALQNLVFSVARITPLSQPDAFSAIYRTLFSADRGPRAGALFSYLDREFLVDRFGYYEFSQHRFWLETGVEPEKFEEWLEAQSATEIWAHFNFTIIDPNELGSFREENYGAGLGIIEFYLKGLDQKVAIQRVLFDKFEGFDLDVHNEADYFQTYALDYLSEIERRLGVKITSTPDPIGDIRL